MQKNIDYRFKILYAVGIILVVSDHVGGYGGISFLHDWFNPLSYHLALFIFSSGYFYNSSNEKSPLKYIWKKIKSLIIPLYIYNVVYGLFVLATRLKGFEIGGNFNLYNIFVAPVMSGHQFVYNMGGWFVIPLFMVETLAVLCRKLLKAVSNSISEWVIFLFSLSLGIVGNLIACMGFYNGWWLVLVRMLYFVPFYALGILYKEKLEKIDKKIPSFYYFACVFAVALIIIYSYGKIPTYTPSWCYDFTEGPVMPVIIGYLGIFTWMRIANILNPVIGKSKWINVIAGNTYSIMINQFLGFMIVKTMFGIISRYYTGFSDFDWIGFKKDIWYFYTPKQVSQMLIFYSVAGLVFPIILQKGINKAKNAILSISKHITKQA